MKHTEMSKIKILGNVEAFGVKITVHLDGWMDGKKEIYMCVFLEY
jgi:hypothetical protein